MHHYHSTVGFGIIQAAKCRILRISFFFNISQTTYHWLTNVNAAERGYGGVSGDWSWSNIPLPNWLCTQNQTAVNHGPKSAWLSQPLLLPQWSLHEKPCYMWQFSFAVFDKNKPLLVSKLTAYEQLWHAFPFQTSFDRAQSSWCIDQKNRLEISQVRMACVETMCLAWYNSICLTIDSILLDLTQFGSENFIKVRGRQFIFRTKTGPFLGYWCAVPSSTALYVLLNRCMPLQIVG